jgi:hypothetical protein
MTREQLMMAVVEAAREYRRRRREMWLPMHVAVAYGVMTDAIDALDAHQPDAEGETVEVAVWRNGLGGYSFADLLVTDIYGKSTEWKRIGTTRFQLAATVEGVE